MHLQRSRKLILAISLATMLALAGGAAIATSAIPGSDGVIHGCYDSKKGTLRVVDPTTDHCDIKKEVAIQWNQTGPQGQQGPQGVQGIKGDQGQPGTDGANGANGETVLNGSGTPSPALGADGDFYIDTTANALYGPKTNGAWGNATNLVGPQGAPGAAGAQGLKGNQGNTGDTGPQGVPGTAGANGVSGYQQVVDEFTVNGTSTYRTAQACPSGMVVLGGGPWRYTNENSVDIIPTITQSAPINATTWEVKIDNFGSARSWDYALVITCANAN